MEIQAHAGECHLELVNLQDADQFSEIRRQRVICGWYHDRQTIQKWNEKQQEGLKSLFWITIRNSSNGYNEPAHVGHISLDAYNDLQDVDLARADKSVLTISRHVMEKAEEIATLEPYGSPRCRFITLNALSKRHIYDEGPAWKGIWERLGISPPPFSIQEWYEKLGYVSWKEKPLYKEKALDAGVIKLWEAFMREEVQPIFSDPGLSW